MYAHAWLAHVALNSRALQRQISEFRPNDSKFNVWRNGYKVHWTADVR
jgi:hypothetical protein